MSQMHAAILCIETPTNTSHEEKLAAAKAYLKAQGIEACGFGQELQFKKGANVEETWERARRRLGQRTQNERRPLKEVA